MNAFASVYNENKDLIELCYLKVNVWVKLGPPKSPQPRSQPVALLGKRVAAGVTG